MRNYLSAGGCVTYSYADACRNIFNTIKMSNTVLKKNIPLNSFERVRKGYERFYVRKVSWRLNRTETYWHPNSSGYNSISFPFSWAAQPGDWGSSLCWDMVLILASSLQLIDFLSPTGYIIIWHPPASCGVTIRTQFNSSTVRVIPQYLRPDAPVIYTGAFIIWQLSRVRGQYVTVAVRVFYGPLIGIAYRLVDYCDAA